MKQRLETLFFHTNMTWKRVILLSVACGVIPGLLMLPDFLEGTSLRQPGISYEFWIFTALLIIFNCKKPLEAGAKTFVFFLISQPLIYLVQVPFSQYGWQLMGYYPTWGMLTLLTFPGGMIAWLVKKGNLLSVLILSVANLILCISIPYAAFESAAHFPKLLLSCVFMVSEIILFILLTIRGKKLRILAFAIVIAMLSLGFIREWNIRENVSHSYGTALSGSAPFTILTEQEDAEIEMRDNLLIVTAKPPAAFPIEIRDAEGKVQTIYFSCDTESSYWQMGTEP